MGNYKHDVCVSSAGMMPKKRGLMSHRDRGGGGSVLRIIYKHSVFNRIRVKNHISITTPFFLKERGKEGVSYKKFLNNENTIIQITKKQ